MKEKDNIEVMFRLLCLGIAVLFIGLGTLSYFSSFGAGWKAFCIIITGAAAIVYIMLAVKCHTKK